MKISQKQYGEMVKKASPNSKCMRDVPLAFLIGGLICVIGQAITDFYSYLGFDDRTSAAWCTIDIVHLLLRHEAESRMLRVMTAHVQ